MSCDSSHHDADHGDLDEGEVGSDAVFDVFGEASAAVEPAEGAFEIQRFGRTTKPLAASDRLTICSGAPAAWRTA